MELVNTVAEQPTDDPFATGVRLHRALVDAVGPAPARNDHGLDDGGYLHALVECCRSACATLPAYEQVALAVAGELRTAEIQYANHARSAQREALLRGWAADRSRHGDAAWFELAAAASSSLGALALLALAADPATNGETVARLQTAYVPWVDALTALLDSLVDRPADARAGLNSSVDHYPSNAVAAVRLAALTARAVASTRELPNGGRHATIVAGMIAMHLSQPTAQLPACSRLTRRRARGRHAGDAAAAPAAAGLARCCRRRRGLRLCAADADADRAADAGAAEPAVAVGFFARYCWW